MSIRPTTSKRAGATCTLEVNLEVTPGDALPTLDPAVVAAMWTSEVTPDEAAAAELSQEQQQQQQ